MRRIRVLQSFGEPRPTTNPYIVMLRDALQQSDGVEHLPFRWSTALFGRFDVFHMHWADTLLAAGHPWTRAAKRVTLLLLLLRLRWQRHAVVRTVHNLTPPRTVGAVDTALITRLYALVDLEIRISETTPESAGIASVLIVHGHYRDWFASMPRAQPVPRRLAYVGLVKPYKGLESLVSAFGSARSTDESLTLRISGKTSDDTLAETLRDAAARTPGLSADLRYLSEDEFVAEVTAGALVVLPYRQMHNSGAALAALSLSRPILVPRNPTNTQLADEVGPFWVRMFDDDLTADDLREAVASVDSAPRNTTAPDLSRREWTDAADDHLAAYRRAVAERLRRRERRHA